MNKHEYLLMRIGLYKQEEDFIKGEKAQGSKAELEAFWQAYHRPVKKIAKLAGLSQRKLAEYFGIPYRTVEDWSRGVRSCSPYIRMMMQEILGIIKRTDEEAKRGEEPMRKYVIFEDTVEVPFKDRASIRPGCVLDAPDQYPKELWVFDTADEAKTALKEYRSDVQRISYGGSSLFRVTEYYAEECHYDEDGDFIEGGDILGFSDLPDLPE